MTSVSAAPPAGVAELDAFSEVLLVGGLGAALDFLNTRTDYRFTFIYKSEPPFARRVMVHDRESLYISSRDPVPVAQTFFEFMLTEPVFSTADGLLDERSCRHPARALPRVLRRPVALLRWAPLRVAGPRQSRPACHSRT
jgi:hypothetical protein